MYRIYFKYGHCPPDFGPRKKKKKKKNNNNNKQQIEYPNQQNPPPIRSTRGPSD
jgi:hypothetical protein